LNGFSDAKAVGERALVLTDELASFSQAGPGVTRLPFTDEHEKALAFLTVHMQEAGLCVSRDAAASLIGLRAANVAGVRSARTLFIGSHQDSIVNGGRYDGILGVIVPLLAIERLVDEALPFDIEVVCFADEEGVRFPTALMGPRALAGTLDSDALSLCDQQGVTLRDALRAFGGDPEGLAQLQRDRRDVLGYIEVHIEQGPVLENTGLSLGVVTGICGIERWLVRVTGYTAHAGTTPMKLRSDALAGACEMVLAVERHCQATAGLVGVVGQLQVTPGVVNAVPGEVCFTVELRAEDDQIRHHAAEQLADYINAIAQHRKLGIERQKTYSQKGVLCDDALQSVLQLAATIDGIAPASLMSGATHDASAMADLCPVGMLFVRCAGGISHHPDESVSAEDCGQAVLALIEAIKVLKA